MRNSQPQNSEGQSEQLPPERLCRDLYWAQYGGNVSDYQIIRAPWELKSEVIHTQETQQPVYVWEIGDPSA